MTPFTRGAARLFSALLVLLPPAVRRRDGGPMLMTFREQLAARRGVALRTAARGLFGLITVGLLLRWEAAVSHRAAARPGTRTPVRHHLEQLLQDIRHATRTALRTPTFTISVVGLTALGIGATTVIFSIVDGVLIRPLPYPESDRLVVFDEGAHSPVRVKDWLAYVRSVQNITAAWDKDVTLSGEGTPERLDAAQVTRGFLELFGVSIAYGRGFRAEEFVGEPRVALLGNGVWRRRFGADPGIVGRTIRLDGESVEVIGVLADGFLEPEGLLRRPTSVYLPFDLDDPGLQHPGFHILSVAGRLAPGITLAQVRAELGPLAEELAGRSPEVHGRTQAGEAAPIPVVPLREALTAEVSDMLNLLLGSVFLLLAIACANVIHLFLARGAERRQEVAVRVALGAGRGRLLRQLVTESLCLAILGGILGVALSILGVELFRLFAPANIPFADQVVLSGRVLGFAAGLAVLTGAVFGLIPGLSLARVGQYGAIRAGSAGAGGDRRQGRMRSALIVVEMALALVLLVGAGLLFNSFVHLLRVDPGFQTGGIQVTSLVFGDEFSDERKQQFARELQERVKALPGVGDASFALIVPFRVFGENRCCWRAGDLVTDRGPADGVFTFVNAVGPGYFRVLGASLTGGEFEPGRTYSDPYPTVLSAGLARRLFGETSPLGREFRIEQTGFRVTGVVADLRGWGLGQAPELEMYVPYHGMGEGFARFELLTRTAGDPGALSQAIREAIWALEPNLSVARQATMREQISASLAEPRFYSALVIAFGVVGLLLAAGGIYATMLYTVQQRRREMGIRVALGATSTDVVSLVVKRAGALALAGLGTGAVAAVLLSGTLRGFVFGIEPTDPATWLAMTFLLAAAALLAAWMPARSAGRVDPLSVLRAE